MVRPGVFAAVAAPRRSMARRQNFSGPAGKIVAARQGWRCSGCSMLLPAAYQVDHTVPLWSGGADDPDTNATAMCANCHAAKTQREAIERAHRGTAVAAAADAEYNNRTDHYSGGVVRCDRCDQRRPVGAPHPICPTIENANMPQQVWGLERFKFNWVAARMND